MCHENISIDLNIFLVCKGGAFVSPSFSLALLEAALHVEAGFVLSSSQIRSFVCVTSAEVNIPLRKPISVNESKRNSPCCAFCSHIDYMFIIIHCEMMHPTNN